MHKEELLTIPGKSNTPSRAILYCRCGWQATPPKTGNRMRSMKEQFLAHLRDVSK